MKQFLEDWKTIGVEIIGTLGFGVWASQSNWDWEPLTGACMSGFALAVSLFIRSMPKKEKPVGNPGDVTSNQKETTNITTVNQSGGQTAHTIINQNKNYN